MEFHSLPLALKFVRWTWPLVLVTATHPVAAQTPATPMPEVPDWAQPGSPTHVQVPPPADFHRPSRNFDTPIGVFEGQSDIGSALVPGSATFDAATGQYTINSAGYNIWYSRDEFRYLWKKSLRRHLPRRRHHLPQPQRLRRPQGRAGDSPESR